ncbi:hypothetical protein DCAR_0623930 [Daucus carota subsp. sativus]|uniref:Uncharacterized protein n=1 Tax=Daucus carota subsp. sativus TaxID=79200 RepID=A0AAF1B618_DAUCS|nr:PREDICTED: putative disease resistance RPP13-like protein 3 [Daucus carota subsp. sativus]WOH04521.1 hypothetical protein DCAR_0623930 [Daucus carota subsp. sativus]
MVDVVVSSAISLLGEFIVEEVNIRLGVKDNVRWLRDELGFLQSSLRQAELRQEEDSVRNWVKNVRDVANDAVIILGKFNNLQHEHEAPKRGVLDCFRGMCKKEVKLYDIGNDIESLKERIVVIKNRRIDYHIDNILATPSREQKERSLLRTTAIDMEVEVVGFEEDTKTLTAEIDSTDPSLKLIYIHGMGGLGKTSLATKLHNSEELRHFDTHAKVCISSEYDIKDVLKRIIKSFMGPEHEQYLSNMAEHDLLHYLAKLLQDRGRYFALIDDIWDIKVWEQIKIAFPNNKNGSRIIITTRNKDVTGMADDKCFVHPLRFLREEESWQLFCKKAEPTTQSMDKLGREMVGKCEGLPLAIVVLSGLLSDKPNYEYWSNVKEHIWRHLKDGGSFRIEDILSLSYNGLSSDKRRDCFLYLARFAEHQIINVDKLKLLWIAEEFISEDDELDGVAMEDLAEDYVNDLINRNLIQIATLLWNGKVSHCRLHDLVHELAINKAKEQKVLGTFDSSQHLKPIALLEGQPRHAIYNGIGEYFNLLEGRSDIALNLCSLALLNNSSLRVEVKLNTKFKNLKVLDLTCLDLDRIPEEIGDLVLLKFLGLARCSKRVLVIPPSIVRLKKLQTICGGSSDSFYIMPRIIWELKELRHLIQGHYKTLPKFDSRDMKIVCQHMNLRSLDTVFYGEWMQIHTIMNITNLHTLSVFILRPPTGNHYTLQSVGDLKNLQTFTLASVLAGIPTLEPLLSCNHLKLVDLRGTIKDPSELRFLPDSVTDLRLRNSGFTEDPMPSLGSLPNLTALELKEVYNGRQIFSGHNAFPSLQILKLEDFPNLEEWKIEDGALPCLRSYDQLGCVGLKTPLQLKHLWKEQLQQMLTRISRGNLQLTTDLFVDGLLLINDLL